MIKNKVYIAGSISNLPIEQVWNKFLIQEVNLKEHNTDVINPLRVVGINSLEEYQNHEPKEWNWHLKECLKALLECNKIYMLSCWVHSKGAMLERDVAMRLGMEIVYL